MAEVALNFQDQAGRPALGIARLPGQDLPGERVHASRGLAGTDGPENGHSGIEAPLRDNEPGWVADFDGFDRVVHLPDNDSRPGVFVGRKGPRGQQLEGSQIAAHVLKPDSPDRDEKQPADNEGDGGGGIVPANDPAVEAGGVIEHQIEHRIVAGHGEGPVEEPPCRAAQPGRDQDRIAPFHGDLPPGRQRPLAGLAFSLPAGINGTGVTPKKGGG